MLPLQKQVLVRKLKLVYSYSIFLWKRSQEDNIKVPAGHLAYVTLLSIVPFLAVIFYMLSAFPMFSELNKIIEDLIYNNFVPTAGNAVKEHMTGFIENTKKMSMMGIASLIVIALLLISTIDQTINRIWRCTNKRSVVQAFTIYWTILSLGPIIIGGSIALSSYLFSIVQTGGFLSLGQKILSIIPFVFSWLAFAGVYTLVPHQRVSFRYALTGGLIAALLFNFATDLFTLYITNFPSQQIIYGALAVIPIMFVWIYFSWLIVLIGAEVTSTLEEFLSVSEKEMQETDKALAENQQ
ncbi:MULTISPECIES: virulence factor BrkB family protein [Psychromonas]|uniref:virulence factor BrkB family protein n=1 Tax=Psychromonas TaxID=67572 RepID=UPI000429218A|nr:MULTISPECIES: virulence factor BrkB family protein [Psychromonas]MBB1271464.1 virulence factor BrkB family protein [Psychromonas sp. SR45-3]